MKNLEFKYKYWNGDWEWKETIAENHLQNVRVNDIDGELFCFQLVEDFSGSRRNLKPGIKFSADIPDRK